MILIFGAILTASWTTLAAPMPYGKIEARESEEVDLLHKSSIGSRVVREEYGVRQNLVSGVSLSGMGQAQETACRRRGGTPEIKGGRTLCTMEPSPHRKTLDEGEADPNDKSRHIKMTLDEEKSCREIGGTPEVVYGRPICSLSPEPDRGMLEVIKGVHRAGQGHGR